MLDIKRIRLEKDEVIEALKEKKRISNRRSFKSRWKKKKFTYWSRKEERASKQGFQRNS